MPLVANRGDGVGIPDTNRSIISTSVDVWDEEGANIGFVQQSSRTDTRQVTPVRHLDSQDAGRIVELAPSPESVQLTFSGMALYRRGGPRLSLAHRMAGGAVNFRSLNGQQIPFDVSQRSVQPSTGEADIEYFLGCLLTNFSKPVNIGTAVITETTQVQVSWVE